MSLSPKESTFPSLYVHRSKEVEEVGYMGTILSQTLDEMAAGLRELERAKGNDISFAEARERAKEVITAAQRWAIMQKWIDQKKVLYDRDTHEWVVSNGGPTILRFAVEIPREYLAVTSSGIIPMPRAVSEYMIAQISLVLQ